MATSLWGVPPHRSRGPPLSAPHLHDNHGPYREHLPLHDRLPRGTGFRRPHGYDDDDAYSDPPPHAHDELRRPRMDAYRPHEHYPRPPRDDVHAGFGLDIPPSRDLFAERAFHPDRDVLPLPDRYFHPGREFDERDFRPDFHPVGGYDEWDVPPGRGYRPESDFGASSTWCGPRSPRSYYDDPHGGPYADPYPPARHHDHRYSPYAGDARGGYHGDVFPGDEGLPLSDRARRRLERAQRAAQPLSNKARKKLERAQRAAAKAAAREAAGEEDEDDDGGGAGAQKVVPYRESKKYACLVKTCTAVKDSWAAARQHMYRCGCPKPNPRASYDKAQTLLGLPAAPYTPSPWENVAEQELVDTVKEYYASCATAEEKKQVVARAIRPKYGNFPFANFGYGGIKLFLRAHGLMEFSYVV